MRFPPAAICHNAWGWGFGADERRACGGLAQASRQANLYTMADDSKPTSSDVATSHGCRRGRRPREGRASRALPAALVALALAARLAFAVALPRDPHGPRADALGYDLTAWGLLTTRTYSYGGERCYVMPVVPLLLAGTYALFGRTQTPFLVLQALLGTAACLIVYLLGRRIWGSSTALAALAAVALHPALAFVCSYIGTEATLLFLVCLAAAAAERCIRLQELPSAFLAGLVFGVGILTKAVMLPLAAISALFIAAVSRPPLVRAAALIAVFVVGCSAPVAPWLVRNYNVTGRAVLSSQTGVVLFAANSLALRSRPGSDRWTAELRREVSRVLRARGVPRGDEIAASDALVSVLWQSFLAHPWQHLRRVGVHLAQFWYKTTRGWSVEAAFFATNYTALCLAAVATVAAIRRRTAGALLIAVLLAAYWHAHGLVLGLVRLSIPVLPLLLLLAAAGFFSLLGQPAAQD